MQGLQVRGTGQVSHRKGVPIHCVGNVPALQLTQAAAPIRQIVMENSVIHSVFRVGSCITICFTTKSWQNKSKTTLCACLHGKLLALAVHLKVCFKSLMLFVTFSNSLLSSRWQEIQVCLPPGGSLFTDKSKTLDKRQPRELADLLAACLTSEQVLLPDKMRNSI